MLPGCTVVSTEPFMPFLTTRIATSMGELFGLGMISALIAHRRGCAKWERMYQALVSLPQPWNESFRYSTNNCLTRLFSSVCCLLRVMNCLRMRWSCGRFKGVTGS
jgi:hypothetical protein